MLEKKKFQRKVENFVCKNCGAQVIGDGYTDHCPVCLWGKHVDVNPGDRAATCGGLMTPIAIEERGGNYRITYQCQKCTHRFTVKTAENDNIDKIVDISTGS